MTDSPERDDSFDPTETMYPLPVLAVMAGVVLLVASVLLTAVSSVLAALTGLSFKVASAIVCALVFVDFCRRF